MISARTPVGQSALSFRVRRVLRASAAALASAALCGCSITERLPGLVDLESAGPAQTSLTAKAEADAVGPPKDNRVIDVGFAPKDP